MLDTLFGIVTEVKPLQPKKASFPILVTLLGITTAPDLAPGHWTSDVWVLSYRMPSTELYATLVAFTLIAVNALQPAKAPSSIFVTPAGIVTEVKLLQYSKARLLMLVTLPGIVTEAKMLHPRKAPTPMLVTVLGIATEVILLQK